MKLLDPRGRFLGTIHVLDLMTGLFLAALLPLLPLGYRMIFHRRDLFIESVSPNVIVAGAGQKITVMGSGFDRESRVRIHSWPAPQTVFINEARLDVVPAAEMTAGRFPIYVRTGGGRMQYLNDALEVQWHPQVLSSRLVVPPEGQVQIWVTGRYLQTGCSLRFGEMEIHSLEWKSRNEIVGYLDSASLQEGDYAVVVTNPNGASASGTEPIRINRPLFSRNRVLALCTLRNLTPRRAKQIVPGPLHRDDFGQVDARILEILGVHLEPGLGDEFPDQDLRSVVIANLEFNVPTEVGPEGPCYTFQKEPLVPGGRFSVLLMNQDVELTILSTPRSRGSFRIPEGDPS